MAVVLDKTHRPRSVLQFKSAIEKIYLIVTTEEFGLWYVVCVIHQGFMLRNYCRIVFGLNLKAKAATKRMSNRRRKSYQRNS